VKGTWNLPGFEYDGRRKRARFAVIVPGSQSRERRRKTEYGVTRDEALVLWKEFRAEVLEGRRRPAPITLAQYHRTEWPKVIKRLAARTAGHETWILEGLLLPQFGRIQLAKINDAVVRDLVADLKGLGYAAASINGVVAVLRKILRDAVDRELIDRVPVRKFPHEKEVTLRLELSDDERASFLAAFDDQDKFMAVMAGEKKPGKLVTSKLFGQPRRFGGGRRIEGEAAKYEFQRFHASKLLFVGALETGLAQGDLLGLRWASLDLKAGWIRIPRAKTGVEATIPISTSCREALAACRKRPIVSEFVFLTEAGKPYSVSTVNRHFKKAKKIAGITRRFRFHDLRHSFASFLASKGVSIQVIAMALGHASPSMSERYARPSEESLRSVTDALDSARIPAATSSDADRR
jgi:integrase